MPETSSAVPTDLLRFERVAGAAAAGVAAQARFVRRAGAALASSRSQGLGGIDLALLGRRLDRHADGALALADRTGDVGHAFASVGRAAWDADLRAYVVDDRLLEACLLLPDGRALSLSDLAAMTIAERLVWLQRLLASPVGSDDPNFRAIVGLLAAAAVAGSHSLFDDEAFRLADAAVLEVMQLGLVAAAAGASWPRCGDDLRSRAIQAWVDHSRASRDDVRDRAWTAAEELAVRYGEHVVDARGLQFGPALEPLVRFTHVYRAAVAQGHEQALLARTLASLEPGGLVRLALDVADVVRGRIDAHFDLPAEPVLDWIRDAINPLDEMTDFLEIAADLAPDWFPLVSGPPPYEVVVESIVRYVTPPALARMLLDPAATPPALVGSILDEVLGIVPPVAHPPAVYYVALLVDRGYLRGLPTYLAQVPGAVPRLPGE